MSDKPQIDVATIRERLAGQEGPQYWRSLEELADTEEFREFLQREFPREASVWENGFSRRDFMKIMGASLALAGLTGCVKQPDEKIIPYVKQPEILVPGKPLYLATAATLNGYATGVLATSHMGRPTGIAGNPDHPASLGSADVFALASILSLYDPDRSQVVMHKGEISTWSKFLTMLQVEMDVQRSLRGLGLRVLTGTVTSPTLGNQIKNLLREFPQAKWHRYEALNLDNVREGSRMAFGDIVDTQYRFERADIVLSLDANFLGEGPASVRYARDFAARRRVEGTTGNMNRLYMAESTPTITGGMADHRLRLKASQVETIARAVAAHLGVRGVSAPSLSDYQKKWVHAVAGDLRKYAGSSVVLPGEHQPPVVHALAHAINHTLGSAGNTVIHTDPVEVDPVHHGNSLQELVRDIDAGQVDMLLILGGNPAYDAPADLDLASKLPKVKHSIHLGLHYDETGSNCTWHIPESHFLEAWGDARSYDGTATIIQPLIAPLYNSKSPYELLEEIRGKSGRKGYDIVREYWQSARPTGNFEEFWQVSVHDGLVAGTARPSRNVTVRLNPWQFSEPPEEGMEIMFRADSTVWDGRFANNGWLQELPKAVTRLTWDNAALMSPATIERLGLRNEQMVELTLDGGTVKAPAWMVPGHPDDAVTLHLGYGRTKSGRVGSKAGVNAYPLRTSKAMWFSGGLIVRKVGGRHKLASTQDHHSMEGRPIIRYANVADFVADPGFAKHMAHAPTPEESLYPRFEYDSYAWGMSIDLNACTGCNACVIACQSENNIPIVGKDQVANGREMHWIRIDRYYEGSNLDDPAMLVQPVACMHCENAPCEVVCPVAATSHDSEGLNVMTYNRCVGTRYCANNCPYKVRRFNFLQYSDTKTETLKMMYNPDVTVRNRGVMEKCTYCVQRISAARIEAKKENREIRDGEVVTACQAACPTQAIVFGNINDSTSNVAKAKAEPRDYGLLAELNTHPRTTYLAKLRNPNPELENA
jgi:MoCo/4Fe-4S cofactor protein with predicted Tat translocation signal